MRSSTIGTSTPTASNSSACSNRWLELLLPPVRLSLGDKLTDRARAHGDALAELKFGLAADGAVVFAKACELGLEGIVSKREGSFYKSGPSRNWLKTKNPDFVRT